MPITLSQDFDTGGLDVSKSTIEDDGDLVRITLVGRDGHMPGIKPGQWKWLHARVQGVAGRRVVFEVPGTFEPGHDRLDGHQVWFSHDELRWSWMDHHEPQPNAYRFWNDQPCRQETIAVAYSLPWRTTTTAACAQRWLSKGCVSPAPSADAQGVIGHTAAGVDETGRAIPALPVHALRFGTGPRRVVLLAGVHPNEGAGDWTLAMAVRGMRQDAQLRRAATFDVYPLVNPAGRYAGLNRTTLDAMHLDSNRVWREDLYADVPSIRLVAEAILHDLAGVEPDVFIDCHSWCTATEPPFCICSAADGFHTAPLGRALAAAGVALKDSGWDNPSTETWARHTLGAKWCATLEATHQPRPMDTALGMRVADALHRALIG